MLRGHVAFDRLHLLRLDRADAVVMYTVGDDGTVIGHVDRGKVVFESQAAACKNCHPRAGDERRAGPELTFIGDKLTRDHRIVGEHRGMGLMRGIEPVQRLPGMYTRTTDPTHIIQEAIDNAADEAFGGHATRIDVTVHRDGSVSVADNGRGIPVDIHPKTKVSALETIMTTLHAGGKFSDKTYQQSGGLHEDGLADTADGFGADASLERKLTIMRDSQIGTYGAIALVLSVLLRASSIGSIADASLVAAALIAAHAGARAAILVFMRRVPNARGASGWRGSAGCRGSAG